MINAIIQYLSGGAVAATGAHSITAGKVMRPTTPGAITPANPGRFDTIRSAPINPSPRYFSEAEAEALAKLAQKKSADLKSTLSAYKSLTWIEHTDTTVHQTHRQYEGAIAESELSRIEANFGLAEKLHKQRVKYARMGYGLAAAQQSADKQIEAIRVKLEEAW
jgi:hypothetical protein